MPFTAEDVAKWMLDQIAEHRRLYQDTVVDEIRKRFGKQFTYFNDYGNEAIGKDVLKAFKAISAETVIWERGDRAWRFRTPQDMPGRQQD